MKKAEWGVRELTTCAYCYMLCLTEADFYKQLKNLSVPPNSWPKFVNNTWSQATTHLLQPNEAMAAPVALVCISDWEKREPVVVAGLLVHEAVHIWQAHARNIGSLNDHGDEEEAYAIQRIAQSLMWSFKEQTK